MGLNNIELITDRALETNLREIREVKKRYPDRALIVSLMVESNREPGTTSSKGPRTRCRRPGAQLRMPARHVGAWHGLSGGPGAGVCLPDHRMGEGGRHYSLLVKLTPNVADIRYAARAATKGGADGLSSSTPSTA